MKRLLSLFTLILTLLLAIPAANAAAVFPDLSGHWSAPEVTRAVAEGWVDGYPDGSFRPEGTITRAEFVKLLGAATQLTPGSETAQTLLQAAASHIPGGTAAGLRDLADHWLYQQGWLEPAVAYGLVVPSDYEGGYFHPENLITRKEIAVMAVRAMGLVHDAVYGETGDLGFRDQNQLPAWMRGYVHQAVQAGLLRGYPDGSFGGDRPATRAEAVAVVRRTVAGMAEGSDPTIRVLVKVAPDQAPVQVPLSMPARLIDNRVYVPARSVFRALAVLSAERQEPGSGIRVPPAVHQWDPVQQQFSRGLVFTAGTSSADIPLTVGAQERQLAGEARVAYGELLLPVRLTTPDDSPFYEVGRVYWEPDTRRVIIYAAAPYGED